MTETAKWVGIFAVLLGVTTNEHAQGGVYVETSVDFNGGIHFGNGYFAPLSPTGNLADDHIHFYDGTMAERAFDIGAPNGFEFGSDGMAKAFSKEYVEVNGNSTLVPVGTFHVHAVSSLTPESFGNLTYVQTAAEASAVDTVHFSAIPANVTQVIVTVGLDASLDFYGPNMHSQASLGVVLTGPSGQHLTATVASNGLILAEQYGFDSDSIFSVNIPGHAIITDAPLSMIVPIDLFISTYGSFSYGMKLSAYSYLDDAVYPRPVGQMVSVAANADNTLKFESLLFGLDDGSQVTPESLGVSLTFDSGIISPNLLNHPAAVPEPASLTLVGMGVVGMAVGAYRRRKQAA